MALAETVSTRLHLPLCPTEERDIARNKGGGYWFMLSRFASFSQCRVSNNGNAWHSQIRRDEFVRVAHI